MPRQKSSLRTVLEPIVAAIALAALARSVVHVYSIPSASMMPVLRVGDHILVTRYLTSSPQRGDVVVFESPRDASELIVKRVVAVPGDLVDSRLGRVRVGGYTLPEPYLFRVATAGAIGPQVVPPDSYFVLGDNREESTDSRNWGAIPASRVVGRARMILWNSSRATGHARADGPGGATLAAAARAGDGSRLFKCID